MAKHAHRVMLFSKKTWKCMLPGCSYFIHTGLEFTIIGRRIVCWECGEEFTATQEALDEARKNSDMPNCGCTSGRLSSSEIVDFEEHIRRMNARKIQEVTEEDEVEVTEAEEEHAADCDIYAGGDCDCK